MKKISVLLLVLCMVASFAFASGSSEAAAPAEKETVALTVWVGDLYVPVTEQIIENFKAANPDVNFDITVGIESESTCKDTVLTDPEAAADVYTFADDQLLALVQGAAIQAVDDVDTVKATIGAGAVDAATIDGTLYAYPMSASNGYFMYYDKSFFTEDDVKSLNTMAEKAAAAGKKVGMQFGADGAWYLYSFFKGAGLDMAINEDNLTNHCEWACEKGEKVCQAILDLVATGGFVADSTSNLVAAAKEGSVVAFVDGTWDSVPAQEAYGDNYACVKLPTYNLAGEAVQMSSFAGYKFIGVNPYSKNVGWAMDFAQFMINEQSQILRFQANGDGPANTKAASSSEVLANPAIAALAAQSAYATVQRVGGNYWSPAATLGTILSQGNPGGTPLAELLATAVAGITAPVV